MAAGSSRRPCLVHLVRAANGLEPYRAFLAAMDRCPPGAEHDFVLAMKGFSDPAAAEPYLRLGGDRATQALHFSDSGLDLDVYFQAARQLGSDRYCFVNSFSEPLAAGWLAMLDAGLSQAPGGIAGASGSWASTRSWTAYTLGLPSAYRGLLPERTRAISQFMAIDAERTGAVTMQASGVPRWRARFRTLRELPSQTLPFPRFPAHHVRTNAFMIENSTLGQLQLPPSGSKHDAYLLESGSRSLTRQLQRRGRRTLVVARDGAVFDHDEWYLSATFWQEGQEGLLVADNQTRCYAEGDAERRRLLSSFAWGPCARPTLP